jgi:hypothetical protein
MNIINSILQKPSSALCENERKVVQKLQKNNISIDCIKELILKIECKIS